ncbi:hypothetical protein [Limnochorda pilosa]|uniref:Porin domain-containing protein n=1 Tax=Limnochorda pilosa TaxID=1555112 RepID=A0A0K2SPJ5_LIMPI|nr:hypothetical protein [Limnochorda pilosa]BAS28734.1 hypothetical protein LIP_2905 [Limnochorda pilosa]
MKKLTVVLSAVMVLALALPASAAPALSIGGKVDQQFKLERGADDQMHLNGYTGLDLEAALSAEGGDPIRAVIEFAPWTWNNLNPDDETVADINAPGYGVAGDPETADPGTLQLDKVYLEAQGAFWNGGPEMTTTIGDVTVEHSPWVANLERRGVKVENLGIGPVTANAFYGWPAEAEAFRPYGLSVVGNMANVGLSTSVVREGEDTELAASAATQVGPAMVSGSLAIDRAQNQAFDINAEAPVMPNLNLHLGYRGGDEAFLPRYADVETLEDEKQASWTKNAAGDPVALQQGVEVGIGTVQYGTQVAASYDQPTDSAKLELARAFALNGRGIDTKYTGTFEIGNEKMTHEIEAGLAPVTVNAEVTAQRDAESTYSLSATYAAPNGMELGAGYHSVDGPSVSAGATVEF